MAAEQATARERLAAGEARARELLSREQREREQAEFELRVEEEKERMHRELQHQTLEDLLRRREQLLQIHACGPLLSGPGVRLFLFRVAPCCPLVCTQTCRRVHPDLPPCAPRPAVAHTHAAQTSTASVAHAQVDDSSVRLLFGAGFVAR